MIGVLVFFGGLGFGALGGVVLASMLGRARPRPAPRAALPTVIVRLHRTHRSGLADIRPALRRRAIPTIGVPLARDNTEETR